MPNLKEIKGREVFSVGKWNGDVYTEKDLDEMVKAFQATSDKFKPYIKLGHNDKQALLDGQPSAGWVTNVYRKGKKLFADISDIPDKIYQLVKNKAYPYVSSEVFWNIDIEGTKYSRMLAGVALLGSDMPAVTSLDDFISLYSIDQDAVRKYTESADRKQYQINIEDKPMPELKKLQDKIDEMTKKYSALEEEKKTSLTEKEALNAEIKEFKANVAKLEQENKEKELDAFIAEQKIVPAQKEYVKALLGEDKKEYSIEKKSYSKMEIFAEFLKLFKLSDVNLDESSSNGKSKDSELEKIEAVKKYALENKCSFTEAYKAIEPSEAAPEEGSDEE